MRRVLRLEDREEPLREVRPSTLPTPAHVYTVSELTARISDCLHRNFKTVLVEGEISNLKLYPSGHLYFTLKDDFACIKAVVFNFPVKFSSELLKNGLTVTVRARIDVYEKRGEYQLVVEDMEIRGLGVLFQRFEALKRRLFEEGLFDERRKRPIPVLPRRIGIITSPAGAAIKDMLKIIKRKFENMGVLIFPVKVQGSEAAFEIVEGIEYFNATKEVDVIILGRGGGSIEDLQPFNEEIVARAIYKSDIPVVAGIGHEIDYTIADFVADLRAPTPTAAADVVVREKSELERMIEEGRERLKNAFRKRIEREKERLRSYRIELKERKYFLDENRMYLDELSTDLTQNMSSLLEGKRKELETLSQRLSDLNPLGVLKRGYSITMKRDGIVVRDQAEVKKGEELNVVLYKGSIKVSVLPKDQPTS